MPPNKAKKEKLRETKNAAQINYCPTCYLDEENFLSQIAFLNPNASFNSHVSKCSALPQVRMKNLEKIIQESWKF